MFCEGNFEEIDEYPFSEKLLIWEMLPKQILTDDQVLTDDQRKILEKQRKTSFEYFLNNLELCPNEFLKPMEKFITTFSETFTKEEQIDLVETISLRKDLTPFEILKFINKHSKKILVDRESLKDCKNFNDRLTEFSTTAPSEINTIENVRGHSAFKRTSERFTSRDNHRTLTKLLAWRQELLQQAWHQELSKQKDPQ